MLNYIWAGLIIISIVFAAGNDIRDEFSNPYGNGQLIKVSYHLNETQNVNSIKIIAQYQQYSFDAVMTNHKLIIPITDKLPERWRLIAEHQPGKNKSQFNIKIVRHDEYDRQLEFILPEIHWVKLTAITQAAFDMAEFAVKLAIGLAGIMALWLGLMHIAEKSGLIFIFVKAVHPLLRWLFPEIPRDHPALGSISLNLAANVLGLGNAATPLGIKAMQQLQELNDRKDHASNAMCMFLALNTSSVQLLPPVTLIALMGAQVSELILPIILATLCSTIAAISVAKLFARRGS